MCLFLFSWILHFYQNLIFHAMFLVTLHREKCQVFLAFLQKRNYGNLMLWTIVQLAHTQIVAWFVKGEIFIDLSVRRILPFRMTSIT